QELPAGRELHDAVVVGGADVDEAPGAVDVEPARIHHVALVRKRPDHVAVGWIEDNDAADGRLSVDDVDVAGRVAVDTARDERAEAPAARIDRELELAGALVVDVDVPAARVGDVEEAVGVSQDVGRDVGLAPATAARVAWIAAWADLSDQCPALG